MERTETGFHLTGLPALIVMLLIGFLAFGLPAMKIARRTGKSPWIGALMSVPVVNIIVIWVFANSHWPKLPAELPNVR